MSKSSLGGLAFLFGAKAIAITLNVALQIVAILQVSPSVDGVAPSDAVPGMREAFLIAFLSSIVLALDASTELASMEREPISVSIHPLVAWFQRHAPGAVYIALLLSFLMLIAEGVGYLHAGTWLFFAFSSLLCVILEMPVVILAYFDFGQQIMFARSGKTPSWHYNPSEDARICNTIDPMLQYLESKRRDV